MAFALPAHAAAEPQPPQIVGARVGFADRYKVGLWTPVEVTLRGGSEAFSGRLSLVVPDGDGVPSRVSTSSTEPCRVAADGKATIGLLCRFGRVASTLTAELRSDDKVVAQRTLQTAPQADAEHFLPGLEFRGLIVTVGPAELGVERLGVLSGLDAENRPVNAQLEDIERLPTHWCGYEGVDAVIVSTSRLDTFRGLKADDARVQALDEWVRMGGRLVLCAGLNAEQILAADAPLRRFAPGRLDKMAALRQAGALETFCGSRIPVPQLARANRTWRVPRLADVQGTVEASESGIPLVVRTARGFGQVIFVAVDLDAPPLSTWSDRPLLVAKLLDMPIAGAEESSEGAAMMHFGFADISGQLRSALDDFKGVRLAPFWLVAALVVAYLLLIGPGDYFLLRKFVGRMQWTWLTFPLVALLVCVGAYFLAHRLKGSEVRVNQANLVDVDTASGTVRGTTWLNVFSPRTENYDLAVRPTLSGADAAKVHTWIAWLGLPGRALGGMDARTATPSQWTEAYDFSPALDALAEMPIPVWSTKSLTARWNGTTNVFPQADLTDEDQILTGAVTNTLGFPLENSLLAYGRFIYQLGTLAPGESVALGSMTKRSELRTVLTGFKWVFTEQGEKYKQEATPYDQSSTDVPYVLRTMMFYEAAGGRRYTDLWNHYQGFVDLTTLLKTDRAILVVQGPSDLQKKYHAATLLRDGRPIADAESQHTTMFRFVFPVKKR